MARSARGVLMDDDRHDETTVKGKRVLVTGAAGFIGSALCRALLAEGADVHATSRSTHETGDRLHWWRVDLSQAESATKIVRQVKPSVIFHLASHVSGDQALSAVTQTMQDNLISAVNVLIAAYECGAARVVLAGSMEEFDPSEPHAVPVSPYAAAKTATSTYARLFYGLYGVPVVNLRIYMVYGPGQHDTTKLVPYVTTSLLRGQQPRLSSGRREVDWIFIDDVVAAFLAAARSPVADGRPVDIGSGELISVRSIVARLTALVGGPGEPVFGALDDRPVEHRRCADVDRTLQIIDWKPRTPLDAGLERTVQWYRSQYGAEK